MGLTEVCLAAALFTAAAGVSAQPLATPSAVHEARVMLARGEYRQAEARAREELTALDATGQGESLAAADHLDLIVSAGIKLGKERAADIRTLAERAVAIRTRLQGPEHPDAAASMVGLADVLRRRRDFAAAQPLYEQALEIREKAFGAESVETAESLNGLANLLFDSGSFDMSLPLYRQVAAIRTNLLGASHPSTADALNNIGINLRQLGDLRGARENLEQAFPVYEQAFGPDSIKVANTLNSLALVLKQDGDWYGARVCLQRALSIYQREFGPAHPYVAGLLNNLADVERKLGDLDAALELFERSLAIREKSLGPDHPDVAQSLNNVGSVLAEQGHAAQARPLLERSLALREKAFGPSHPNVAMTLSVLGGVLAEQGELGTATQVLQRAQAIREKQLGAAHPYVAEVLNNLALIHLAAGDHAAALENAERAATIWEAAFGNAHPNLAQALVTLARVQRAGGRRAEAFSSAVRAEEVARSHLRAAACQLSEAEALRYAAVRVSGRDLAFDILAGGPSTPSERRTALTVLARSRGIVLEALQERRGERPQEDTPRLQDLRRDLAEARAELARRVASSSVSGQSSATSSSIEDARRRREVAERALAASDPTARARLARDTLSFDQLASTLPAGSALVSFVRVRLEPTSSGVVRSRVFHDLNLQATYLALVLRAGATDPALVTLGDATRIDALVQTWAAEAARGALAGGRSPGQALRAYRDAGRALRAAVWDPLLAALDGVRFIVTVSDGALNLVNWAALPTGSASYLLESGPLLHRLTAERELLFPAGGDRGKALLAVGDPAFGEVPRVARVEADAPPAADPANRFPPLPGAALEAEEIAAIWRASLAGATEGSATLLTGERATEAAFKELSPRSTVLHIATHGFFSGGTGGAGSGSTRGLGGLAPSSGGPTGIAAMEGPVGAAGLAFAGANRTGRGEDGEDGILSAEEVAALDLDRAEWAVLSACDTGIGALHASEGVLGLQRAFRAAGARAVVMSLWAVDDQVTRTWMGALYRARLERRLTTAEAVRAAALEILRQRRAQGFSHPFSWGGFVATGDWR